MEPRSRPRGSRETGHHLDDETSRGLEIDELPKSGLTEQEIQRLVREALMREIPHLADLVSNLVSSRILDTAKDRRGQPIHSWEEDDTVQREVRKELEHASYQSAQLVRSSDKCRKKDEVRNLQLQFKTSFPHFVYTGKKLEGMLNKAIGVELVNAKTGNIVKSGPECSIEVKVVVLDGDFGTAGYDKRTQEEFEKSVVTERIGKRPLLIGNLVLNLNGGTGVLGDVRFTDNSGWTKSGKFRLGLQVLPEYREYIREAITEPFAVKENRGQLNEKHFPPLPSDEVWRLKNIGKDGIFHKKLSEAQIYNVKGFLQQVNVDPEKLRKILGEKMTMNKWEDLLRHAKTCPLDGNPHVFLDKEGDHENGCQLTGVAADRVHAAADEFSLKQENHGDRIGKASSSFPSQVSGGQIENLTPVQHNLGPRTCAAPVGPEAPSSNGGSIVEADELACPASHQPTSANNWNGLISPGDNGITSGRLPTRSHDINLQYAMPSQMIDPSRQMDSIVNEHFLPCGPTCASISSFQNVLSPGHNGVTALPLLVQSQDTYFGHAMELSANELAHPASQPTSANNWNGLISPGDNGTTMSRLPTVSHDINLHYAMPSQMINPSRQMDSTMNEHILPSGPICASISSFRNGHNGVTAMPLPVQSKNTYIGNAMEFSTNELPRPASASHQPTSANYWNGQISPGDNGITTGGLPKRSHDINIQYAMPSQMIDPSRQMDSIANEHVLPSGPTCASISSFRNGHNGVTDLPLPIQSQNTYLGNAIEFSIDELACPASHQPTSANNWNGLISPGDNGIATGGLPTQFHDINLQYAMPSQMIGPSRQMDSTVNEHVLPSGLTGASISSFRNVLFPGHTGVTTLPLPAESQNTFFGNASANELVRPASPQPTSANNRNGLMKIKKIKKFAKFKKNKKSKK